MTFHEFPKAHWKHLRTSKVVESPCAAVRGTVRISVQMAMAYTSYRQEASRGETRGPRQTAR